MLTTRLYMMQRISALVMVPLVLGHLILMIYAIGGGLTGAEILARTQGSLLWFAFYGLFVVAVSLHGAIGLRVILHETLKIAGMALNLLTWGIACLLTVLGIRAVWAVTFAELAT